MPHAALKPCLVRNPYWTQTIKGLDPWLGCNPASMAPLNPAHDRR
jgi:transcriptional accessory protein Tex/SPT6